MLNIVYSVTYDKMFHIDTITQKCNCQNELFSEKARHFLSMSKMFKIFVGVDTSTFYEHVSKHGKSHIYSIGENPCFAFNRNVCAVNRH